jgi:hypothetical protein
VVIGGGGTMHFSARLLAGLISNRPVYLKIRCR